jgi:hypothetical protein
VNFLPADTLQFMRTVAVIAAAIIGAFASGAVVKIVAGLTMPRKKIPLGVSLFVRVTGAVALGWLAATMFGTGHGGFWPFGRGPGPRGENEGGSTANSTAVSPKDQDGKNVSRPEQAPVAASDSLQIEVLSPAAAKKLLGASKSIEHDRIYRVDVGNGPEVFTLEELKSILIRRQKSDQPLRRVILVSYLDSTERLKGDLKNWIEKSLPPPAKGEKISVDIAKRDRYAPTE